MRRQTSPNTVLLCCATVRTGMSVWREGGPPLLFARRSHVCVFHCWSSLFIFVSALGEVKKCVHVAAALFAILYVQDEELAESLVPKLVSTRRTVQPDDVLRRLLNDAELKHGIQQAFDRLKDEWVRPNTADRRSLGPPGQKRAQGEAAAAAAAAIDGARSTIYTSYTVPDATQLSRQAGAAQKDAIAEALLDDDGRPIEVDDDGEEVDISVCIVCKSKEAVRWSPFIGCDECPRWYHVRCTNDESLKDCTTKQSVDDVGHWICPACVEKGDKEQQ